MSSAPARAHEAGLARCLAIVDVNARVACYDKIARAELEAQAGPAAIQPEHPAKAALAVAPPIAKAEPPLPSAAALPATAPQAKQQPAAVKPALAKVEPPVDSKADRHADFGLSDAQRDERSKTKKLNRITAVVVSTREVTPGYWEFKMQDGSVWRLTDSRPLFRPPHIGDTVAIRRASLGSYLLDVGRQASIHVKRIRLAGATAGSLEGKSPTSFSTRSRGQSNRLEIHQPTDDIAQDPSGPALFPPKPLN